MRQQQPAREALGFELSIEGSDNNLVMNPQRHFILFGAKFASVREVMLRKEQRGKGVKDMLDLIDLQWALDHDRVQTGKAYTVRGWWEPNCTDKSHERP